MALKVWLPLNGTLENQGLSTLVSSGTPTFLNDGKMGKCISLTPRVSFTGLPKLEKFTILFWLKVDSCTTDWSDSLLFKDYTSADVVGSSFRFEATQTTRACSFHDNTGYAVTKGSRILITNSQYGEWHHCGFSCDGQYCYTYIDGVLTYTDTAEGGYLYNYFHIGETDRMVGGMNDLRVYDEVLSDKQIKEIAKGLCAHYKLEGAGANENLATNSFTTSPSGFHDYTSKASASRITDNEVCTSVYKIDFPEDSATYSNYNLYVTIPRDSSAAIQDGKTYTLSFKVKASKTLTNYKFLYEYNNTTLITDIGTEWQKIVLTGVANNQYSALYVCHGGESYRHQINGGSLYIAEVKLELGSVATPYIPHSAENEYTALEYNNILSRDVSGFGYNGTITGELTFDSDSPRYAGSTKFNGNANYIAIGRPMPKDELTVNVWAYMEDWSQYNGRLASCTQGGGWNFEPSSKALNFAIGVGESSNTYMTNFSTSQSALANISSGWHMFTGTFDGINKKLYIDGELKGSINTLQNGTTLTTKTPIFYNSQNGIFIGAEAEGTTTAATSPYFSGLMSDFRIYSTALSAEDILKLYEISGIIDNKGNTYSYEFIEED